MKNFISPLIPPSAPAELAPWGASMCKAMTELTDKLTFPAFKDLDATRVGVYAVGGYGRSELVPFSDIDILFVTRREIDLSESIAALWSLGLKPSVLIRNFDLLKKSASEDLMFATTLIDARRLFGLEVELLLGRKSWIKTARPKFSEEHETEKHLRHMKFRGAGNQEPNVRDGRGGLRDIQVKRWIAAVEDPAGTHVLTPEEETDYRRLLAIRTIIHCALEKREDRLLLSEQQTINDWLGWSIQHNFAKETLSTMKRIALGRADAPLLPRAEVTEAEFVRRISISSGELSDADEPLSVFLRRCDASGDLGRLIPEWSKIECLTRNDPIHLFAPEEHTLRALEHLEELFKTREPASLPVDLSAVKRKDLLTLAVLFHDIGKGSGQNHSQKGRMIAEKTMERWGSSRSDIDTVCFLVEQHLLLSHNAFMRDVHDPSLIHSIARKIGDIEKLTMLYLLTVADIKAVATDSFTDWKANLLNTLTKRLYRQCQVYLPPAQLAEEILRRRREAVGKILSGKGFDAETEKHFATIDARYALAHSPEQIAQHIQLIPRLESENAVIVKNFQGEMGFSEVIVITRTHHGLFAEIAGTISAKGFDILEADISTRTDGIAIDSFKVSDSFHEDRWVSFEKDLQRLLSKEISAASLLAARIPYAKKSDRKLLSTGGRKPVILFDNECSRTDTVVEVMAPDEMGLLYRIATIFRDCDIGITSAIVSTSAGLGVDVFYVTTTSGEKITDKAGMERIEYLLSQVITADTTGPE